MIAVTIQSNKIVSNKVKDNYALLEPPYGKKRKGLFGQTSVYPGEWLTGGENLWGRWEAGDDSPLRSEFMLHWQCKVTPGSGAVNRGPLGTSWLQTSYEIEPALTWDQKNLRYKNFLSDKHCFKYRKGLQLCREMFKKIKHIILVFLGKGISILTILSIYNI